MAENAGQIRLRLSTKDGDLLLPEENSIILVPTCELRSDTAVVQELTLL